MDSSRTPAWIVPAVVLALAAALITVIVLHALGRPAAEPERKDPTAVTDMRPALGPTAPTHVQNPGLPDFGKIDQRVKDDPFALGVPDAPVVMLAFSDYQCPFCALWTHRTLPDMRKYVEAGQLRIEWHDIAIFGPDSERGALAAAAAAAQSKFWEYHEALYPNGEIRKPEQLSRESLLALAGELGLDTQKFAADMDAPEAAKKVADNKKLGSDLGVYSTPVFVVGGKPIIGAQPSPTFTDAVENALKEAGR